MQNLPIRKTIRLKEYDYSQNGYYFITICINDMKCVLSDIVGGDDPVAPIIKLTEIGIIIEKSWNEINNIYKNIKTDEFVIMPNHFHGIVIIDNDIQKGGQGRPPLHKIVQGFKSVTTRLCYKYGYSKIWQRNYYEHIIRTQEDYLKITEYINTNPLKWELDKYYIKNS